VSWSLNRWNVKAEWIEGRDVRGLAGWTERVYFVHGGYRLRPSLEVVARLYNGKSTVAGATTDLTNSYLGVTAHIVETGRFDGRLQVNYVAAGGDETRYSGVSGYRDDAILIQFQIYAEK
jgi:hypothetical protein